MERKLRYSWIIPERLAVGERPPSFAELLSRGFTGALSLQEESEPGPWDEPQPALLFRRVKVRDGLLGGVPSPSQIQGAVDAIGDLLREGRRTYVYCYAGVGRSPLVCMAYLAKSENLTLVEAYRKVSGAHPPTEPTAGQLQALDLFIRTGPGASGGPDPSGEGP